MKKTQSNQIFTEKERAVINLVAAGVNDVVKACRTEKVRPIRES